MWNIKIETKMYRQNGVMDYSNRVLIGNIPFRNEAIKDLKALYNVEETKGVMDRKGLKDNEYFVHREYGNQNYYTAEIKRVYLCFEGA